MKDTRSVVASWKWPLCVLLAATPFLAQSQSPPEAVHQQLAQKQLDERLERDYADGITAMNKNDLGGALAAFEKVRKLNPEYRDVAGLMEQVESVLSPETDVSSSPMATLVNVDSLYQAGVAAAARQDWMQAVVELEKVHHPN